MRRTGPARDRAQLREFALGLPGAYEDHPWGEDVVKVGKKVFIFLGVEPSEHPGVGLKLVVSHPLALAQAGVEPMGYGLGKSGWISIRLGPELPVQLVREWILESYRTVAPKRLVEALPPDFG